MKRRYCSPVFDIVKIYDNFDVFMTSTPDPGNEGMVDFDFSIFG